MTCHEVIELLPVYLDHELSGREARLVESHLAACAACRAALARQAHADARVARLRSSAPSPALAVEVMDRIAGLPAMRTRARSRREFAPALVSLGVVVMLALAIAFVLLPGRRSASPPPVPGLSLLHVLRAVPQGELLVLDAVTLSPVATIPLAANPTGMTISADGRCIYVSGGLPDVAVTGDSRLAQSGVWVLDSKTLTVTATIAIGYAAWDVAMGVGPGQILLTLQQTGRYLSLEGAGPDLQAAGRLPGQLLSLNTSTRQVTALADLLALPRGLVTTSDGKLAFAVSHDVVNYDDTEVAIVDVPARRTLATIVLPGAEALVADPDGQRVFVASVSEPYIWVIERRSLKAVAYRLAGLPPATEVRQMAVSPDGLLLALALAGKGGADGGLLVLDTRRFDTLLVLPAAGGYQAVAFAPDHKHVYAATLDGRLDVIAVPGGRLVGSIAGVGNVLKIVAR